MSREQKHRVRRTSEAIERAARSMRRTPTGAEALLWRGIRGRNRGGYRFRRQHPHGRFILDFCCPALKLVVEVDGHVHGAPVERDAFRTAALEAEGYHVIRFRSEQVLLRIPWVLDRIDDTIATLRTEFPLPFMGEGGEP